MKQTLQLGSMHPHMLAAYHDSMGEYQRHSTLAKKNSAMATHPSAGKRSAEFHQAAGVHAEIAGMHHGIMTEAAGSVAPAEKLASRMPIFKQALIAANAKYS